MKTINVQLNKTNILIMVFILLLIIGIVIMITKNSCKCEFPDLQKYDNKFATNVE